MKTPARYQNKNEIVTADRCTPLTRAAQSSEITLHALAREGYPGVPLHSRDLAGLLSVGYWDAPCPQHWGLETHCNEGIELAFLETGKLAFKADRKYILRPGEMTITRPWQPHSLGDPAITPSRLHWLILDVGVRKPHQAWAWPDWIILTQKDREELTTLLRQNELPVRSANEEIAHCFKKIVQVVQGAREDLSISRLTISINELFLALYETLKKRRVKLDPELITSHRTVELFLESLVENKDLLRKEWTVESMAESCHLGVTHFTRLCKTLSNRTPVQYLNYHRIQAAIQLLQTQPQITITEAAFQAGFNSSQYFATVFRQIMGRSPRSYRHRQAPQSA